MADTFNLGWKLAAVVRGHAAPALLDTYSEERQAKAKELIDFDRDMARLFSEKPKTEEDAARFQSYFKKHARYTAGVETRYDASLITGDEKHQDLAAGLRVGMRFHSAPVVRLGDARPMELGSALLADGRWRLIAFAGDGDVGQAGGDIAGLCDYLTDDAASPLVKFTRKGDDIDGFIDLRAVFQTNHREMDISSLPDLLLPAKGKYGLRDYEKAFCPDLKSGRDIFDMREIDRQHGALVLVRPDQFIAQVCSLGDHARIAAFFDGFLL